MSPETVSFTGSKLRAFNASKLRARERPKAGYVIMLWSGSWFKSSDVWWSLYDYSAPPNAGTPPHPGWVSSTTGYPAYPVMTRIQTGTSSPYMVDAYTYAGSGGGLSQLSGFSFPSPTYTTDEDPLKIRVLAYTHPDIQRDVIQHVPWGTRLGPGSFGLGGYGYDPAKLVPYQGSLVITSNLLKQFRQTQPYGSISDNWIWALDREYAIENAEHNYQRYDGPVEIVGPWDMESEDFDNPEDQHNVLEIPLGPITIVYPNDPTKVYSDWGCEVEITHPELDDDLYIDPYEAYFGKDTRPDEILKEASEPIGHRLQLKDPSGNIFPDFDDEEPQYDQYGTMYFAPNQNMYISAIINNIHTYHYYRVSRIAAALVSMVPVTGQQGNFQYGVTVPTTTPFIYLFTGFGDPVPPPGQVLYSWITGIVSGVIGPAITHDDFTVGVPGFGWPYGTWTVFAGGPLAYAFVPLTGGPADAANWRSVTSLLYYEFITDLPANIPVGPTPGVGILSYPSGIVLPLGSSSPSISPLYNQYTYSTKIRERIDYDQHGPVYNYYPDNYPNYESGSEPGPVDDMEEFIHEDYPPFFHSLTDYWPFGSHRRLLHGWSLTKTVEEMYEIADDVGDSLDDLKAMAAADLAVAHSFVVAHANAYHVGTVAEPDNEGTWIYGVGAAGARYTSGALTTYVLPPYLEYFAGFGYFGTGSYGSALRWFRQPNTLPTG